MRTLAGPTSLRVSDHACVACATVADAQAALAPYFQEGLELGERCIYIAEDPSALTLDRVTQVGRDEVFGKFDPERVLDWIRTHTALALRGGHAGLRLACQCAWTEATRARFPELEARFNYLMATGHVAILCVYDRTTLPAHVVRDMLATHPLVVVGNDLCKNPHYIAPEDFLAKDRPAGEVERFIGQLHAAQVADNARHELDDRRRALSRNTFDVLEVERRSIARALHDDVGQALTELQQAIEAGQDPAQTLALFGAVRGGVRALHHELRPPGLDELGLPAAIRSHATREARRGGFELLLALDDLDVDRDLAIACFRILQEALANIVRHARATKVEVSLQNVSGRLDLVVRDDGVGFDPTYAHPTFGLLAMTERAELAGGSVEITSAPSSGTTVHARL